MYRRLLYVQNYNSKQTTIHLFCIYNNKKLSTKDLELHYFGY